MFHRHCLIVTVVAAFSCSVRADVVFVDAVNCPGPGDGSELDPYCSIQTAIDNAVDTDEILVAPGTYFETINFLGKAITLRSSDGPAVTTIDGTGFDHVVQCVNLEGPDTMLEGFTVTGGSAPEGGGMFIAASAPTVTNCTFSGNMAERGGGMEIRSSSHATVTNCTFSGNTTPFGFGFGGAIYINGGSALVKDCDFVGNSAASNGGALSAEFTVVDVIDCTFEDNISLGGPGRGGGAILAFDSQILLVGCEIHGNTAASNAGGIGSVVFDTTGSLTLVDCSISDNTARIGGGIIVQSSPATVIGCTIAGNVATDERFGWGGGVFMATEATGASNLVVINTLIHDNFAQVSGAGISADDDITIVNSTITGNVAVQFAGGVDARFGTVGVVYNTVLWENVAGGISDEPAQIRVDPGAELSVGFSCVQGLTGDLGGSGNIDADPLFVDPLNGNFRLSPGSPCIDAGHNWAVLPDFLDLDGDGDTVELTSQDLDGNPRFVHAAVADHPGCRIPAVVDMGAYELPDGAAAEIRLGDIDGNGAVDIVDFVITLGSWGPCEPGCCLADLDLDGTVGIIDFLLLLGNWG